MDSEQILVDDEQLTIPEFMFLCDFYNSPMKPDWMTWDEVRVILIDMLGKQLSQNEFRGLRAISYEPGRGMTCFLVFETQEGTRYHCMIPDNYVEGGHICNITTRDEDLPDDTPDSPSNDDTQEDQGQPTPEPQEEPFVPPASGIVPLSMIECDYEPEQPTPEPPYVYDEEFDRGILEDLEESIATIRPIPRHGNPFREYPTAEERLEAHKAVMAQARQEYEEAMRNGTSIF